MCWLQFGLELCGCSFGVGWLGLKGSACVMLNVQLGYNALVCNVLFIYYNLPLMAVRPAGLQFTTSICMIFPVSYKFLLHILYVPTVQNVKHEYGFTLFYLDLCSPSQSANRATRHQP